MKTFLLIIVAAFCMLACKKNDNMNISPNFFGKWEVSRRYGGNILPADSVFKPGNGNILQFNSDSTYKQYTRGVLSQQGIFHIRKNGYRMNQTNYNELFFDADTSFASLISLTDGVLIIRPLLPDIGTTEYKKVLN